MPNKRQKTILITAIPILVLLLIIAAVLLLTGRQASPLPQVGPTVLITNPDSPGSGTASPSIQVQAAAYGDHPIHHLELWMDGQLSQVYYNPELDETSLLEISFSQPLTRGGHLLFVRAVDTQNLVGQSLPIQAEGTLDFTGEGPVSLVQIQPGETLEDTLAASGADLAAVLPSNPGLSSESPPGTTIALPIQPEEGGAPLNPSPPPGNPTALDWIQLLPGANPPLALIPARVFGPPQAPAGLQINADGCDLELTWQDESETEAGFQIWVTGLGVGPRVAARTKDSPGTGPVSVQIPALGSGDFVYWIEAYNIAGAQPGNQAAVSVAGPCSEQLGGDLALEVLDFNAPAQFDRAYCYISLFDHPEVRLPAGQDQFITLSNGTSDLAALPASSRSYRLPVAGESLKIGGECWGWAGGTLSKLGSFGQTIEESRWDGTRLPLLGPNYEIGLQLTRSGGGNLVPFAAPDPGIPSPRILSLEAAISLGDVGLDPMEALDYLDRGNLRNLTWEWIPSPGGGEPATGFTVLVNGVNYMHIPDPDARSAELRLPGFCGTQIMVSLTANIEDRQSLPSAPYEVQLPPCTLYAVVDFKSVQFGWVNDSANPNNHCDDVETYFQISVSETLEVGQSKPVPGQQITKNFNGGGFYQTVHCGTYDLNHLAGPAATAKEIDPTRITLPLRLIEGSNTEYGIEAVIWDYDWGSGDEVIARFKGNFYINPSMVNGLMANMSGSPKSLPGYYCDAYIATFNGDAKSKIDVCVDLYAENPSTGAANLPGNTPLPETPPYDPGLSFKTLTDLVLEGIHIGQDGSLFIRVRNEGPDDLVNQKLEITTSIQSDQPGISGTPWTSNQSGFTLKNGARRDLKVWPWDILDPAQYSYTVQVEIAVIGFEDSKLNNNTATQSWSGEGLPVVPDPLYADIKISAIQAFSPESLAVVIENAGPDLVERVEAVLSCQVTGISRPDGSSAALPDLALSSQVTLDAGAVYRFKTSAADLDFNLLTHWYQVSCQLKAEGFADPDPANNFLTQVVY